jgi:hypothetical protein
MFSPVAMALIEGQDSLVLLALFAAAIAAEYAHKDLKASVLVGLAPFKFQYAIAVVALFLIWKRWRFLTGFAISASAVVSLSVWLTCFSGSVSYVRSIIAMSAREWSPRRNPSRRDAKPSRHSAYVISGGWITISNWIVLMVRRRLPLGCAKAPLASRSRAHRSSGERSSISDR